MGEERCRDSSGVREGVRVQGQVVPRWVVEPLSAARQRRRRKLIWRVTWKFVAVDAEFTDPRVEESTVLASCVERHLRPQGPDKAVLGHRLRKYQQLGAANLRYFLPAERCPVRNAASPPRMACQHD